MISKIPTQYTGYIGRITVRSPYRYIVYGPVRGLVSRHRTAGAAEKSAQRDRNKCRKLAGGKSYSDAAVYVMDRAGVEGWKPLT